jgi:glycosyltransferase involved in cell wall biosynthesis
VGTHEIRDGVVARRRGRLTAPVHLIEPPIDVRENAPDHPVEEFQTRFGLDRDHFDMVIVSRLAAELKLEGILTAIEVIGRLADELPMRLIIVGDGPSRALVEKRAAEVNAKVRRRVVVVTGALDDPRPAYAAATVTIGMGGSALRALAFARPLIVQGEHGFFELLTPDSAEVFLRQGWYGLGGRGATGLADLLLDLYGDERRREKLGAYGRDLVVERFSLERAARVQELIYMDAVATGPVRFGRDAVTTASGVLAHKARRHWQRLRGTAARDDFNAVTAIRGRT